MTEAMHRTHNTDQNREQYMAQPDNTAGPSGQLLLKTLAMPADTNANGDIFGGWIMSQLDLAGSILAKETSLGRTVTVSVSSIAFKHPVKVGNMVCCYGECVRIGNTSMAISLELWVTPVGDDGLGEQKRVCDAMFHYVAIDQQGRPRQIEKN